MQQLVTVAVTVRVSGHHYRLQQDRQGESLKYPSRLLADTTVLYLLLSPSLGAFHPLFS